MAVGRNRALRTYAPDRIMGAIGPLLVLSRLARLELRPGHDLARAAALRPIARPDQCGDRDPLFRPSARPGAAQPRRRSLYRPHRRAAHHARLLLGDGACRRVGLPPPAVLDVA